MNAKVSSTIDKACQERSRSNFDKALSRLEDGIRKHPKALPLYTEAVDVAMEAGESLKALQFFKQAQKRLPDDVFELWTFAADKVGKYNDPIVGRYLVEQAIKNGEVATASSLLADLKDHTADELLQRVRTKKQAMSTAIGGGLADRDEVISFAITEALLCIRLNRFNEAMDGLKTLLEEKPYAHKMLEPFLIDIESHHKEKGEASFALGCCLLAADKPAAAVEKLVHATKITPALMPDAISKIDSLGDDTGIPLDTRNLRLAELYLAHGNKDRAEELIRNVLERDPANAVGIIELLESHVRSNTADLKIEFLFVDAALGLGRRDTALGQLKKIFQKHHLRARLMGWLEEKSQVPGTASDILLFFGEAALGEGMHGRAIEIFKEVLSHGVQDEPAIKQLLSRHLSVPIIRHFFTDRFGAPKTNEPAAGGGFETYDSLDLAGGAEITEPVERDHPRATTIRQVETKIDGKATPPPTQTPFAEMSAEDSELGIENHDFSLGGSGVNDPEEPFLERADSPSPEGSGGDDLFDYLKKDFLDKPGTVDDGLSTGESAVDGPSDLTFAPKDDIVELAPEDLTGGAAAMDDQRIDETPRDFDALFELFSGGQLDNLAAIELVERALALGRLEEMKSALMFIPANIGEDIQRKRLLAEYYLEIEKPLPALIALKTINISALDKDQRKQHLSRIAVCYRALQNFEAAHSVYLRLLSENPATADLEQTAACNYDEYLRSVTGSAPALEKISSL
jgi:tetratricopeptide (TPR) repeat protein